MPSRSTHIHTHRHTQGKKRQCILKICTYIVSWMHVRRCTKYIYTWACLVLSVFLLYIIITLQLYLFNGFTVIHCVCVCDAKFFLMTFLLLLNCQTEREREREWVSLKSFRPRFSVHELRSGAKLLLTASWFLFINLLYIHIHLCITLIHTKYIMKKHTCLYVYMYNGALVIIVQINGRKLKK